VKGYSARFIILACSLALSACSGGSNDPSDRGDKTAPIIQLSNPLPGDGDSVVGSLDISWTLQEANPARMEIWLSDDGGAHFNTQLANLDKNVNSYSWNSDEPATSPDGSNYKLRLSAIDVPGNRSSVESGVFSITNHPSSGGMAISIDAPIGGSNNLLSGVVDIKWTATNISSGTLDIDIEQYINGSYVPLEKIASALPLPQTSHYLWDTTQHSCPANTICEPNFSGNTFIIKLTVHNGPDTATDRSSNVLYIDNNPPQLPTEAGLMFHYNANNELELSWLPGSDFFQSNYEPPNAVPIYHVVYSNQAHINSLADIIDFGNSTGHAHVLSGTGIFNSNFVISGASNADSLYWNVVIEDSVGNRSLYKSSKVEGVLNHSFGSNNNGLEISTESSTSAYNLAFDSQNRILIVGTAHSELAVWRYNVNAGAIDYGLTKLATLPYSLPDNTINSNVYGEAIAVDGNDKIVVCGEWNSGATSASDNIVVARFLSDGTLDKSFSGAGYNTLDYTGNNDSCSSLAVDSNNNVYIAGKGNAPKATSGFYFDAIMAKFLSNGLFDSSFGQGGKVVVNSSTASVELDDQFYDLHIDASNHLIATGYSETQPNATDAKIWQYDLLGKPVNFSSLGANSKTFDDTAYDIATYTLRLDSAGHILVYGDAVDVSGNTYPFLWRVNADGSDDTTFAKTGNMIISQLTLTTRGFYALAFDLNDNILIANTDYYVDGNGTSLNNTNIMRIRPDGTPDNYSAVNAGTSTSTFFLSYPADNIYVSAIAMNPTTSRMFIVGAIGALAFFPNMYVGELL